MKLLFLSITILLTYSAAKAEEPLNITENTALFFGKVIKPSSGSETIRLDVSGGVTGTITRIGSTEDVGDFTITGDNATNIDITITPGATSGGITIQSMRAKYGTAGEVTASGSNALDISNAAAPTTGGTTLLIGGELSIASSVSTGNGKTVSYTLDVSYVVE